LVVITEPSHLRGSNPDKPGICWAYKTYAEVMKQKRKEYEEERRAAEEQVQ